MFFVLDYDTLDNTNYKSNLRDGLRLHPKARTNLALKYFEITREIDIKINKCIEKHNLNRSTYVLLEALLEENRTITSTQLAKLTNCSASFVRQELFNPFFIGLGLKLYKSKTDGRKTMMSLEGKLKDSIKSIRLELIKLQTKEFPIILEKLNP